MGDALIQKLKGHRRNIIGLISLIILILLTVKCVADVREKGRQREAIATAEGIAKVIRENLSEKKQLIVQHADGWVSVTAVDRGPIFTTSQTSKMPYSAHYSVDLARVSPSTVRYNESAKILFVELPEIAVSAPNVDEKKKIILRRTGVWTSRRAGERLAARATKLADAGARESINKPEKIERARENARRTVDQLLELSLGKAGNSDVDVIVRFSGDSGRSREQWDVSPSIAEVLAGRA